MSNCKWAISALSFWTSEAEAGARCSAATFTGPGALTDGPEGLAGACGGWNASARARDQTASFAGAAEGVEGTFATGTGRFAGFGEGGPKRLLNPSGAAGRSDEVAGVAVPNGDGAPPRRFFTRLISSCG